MARLKDIFGTVEDVTRQFNAPITAGGVQGIDLDVSGYMRLTVAGVILAAGAGTDAVVAVKMYDEDGTTLVNADMPTLSVQAGAFPDGNAYVTRKYDVTGVKKVRVELKNANVATKTGIITTYLG